MNCDRCQELIGDLMDGSLSGADESTLKTHINECLDCDGVRQDLSAILGYCRAHRGEYDAPPNDKAMWLRILNVVEAETASNNAAALREASPQKSSRRGWLSRSWELSFAQLAAFAVAIILFVSVATAVGLRRWQSVTPETTGNLAGANLNDRIWQRQQVINYWNQRIELNKARWNAQMRETFDRNLNVINQVVSESMNELNRNPHDEISEQMLNEALNDKLALLKEFSDL